MVTKRLGLIVSLAGLLLGNGSERLSRTELEGSDTTHLAARLLPPAMAQDAASHEILGPYLSMGPPAGVRFPGRPHAVGEHLCARTLYHVALRLAADEAGAPLPDTLEPASPPVEQMQIAFAEQCDAAGTARYATVRSASVTEAAAVLQSLAALQAAARTGQVLPVRLSCQSDLSVTACSPDPAAVLAALPLDAASIVEAFPSRTSWRVVIADAPPGSPVWEIGLDGPADAPEAISLHRSMPAPS